jgi:hypothetical protein
MHATSKNAKVKILGKPLTKGCSGGFYLSDTNGALHFYTLGEADIELHDPRTSKKRSVDFRDTNLIITTQRRGQDTPQVTHYKTDTSSFTRALHLITQGYTLDISPILKLTEQQPRHAEAHSKGALIEDEGYYIGLWEPLQKDGFSLCELFDVYAAPTDAMQSATKRKLLTHEAAIDFCASAHNWHGHNGLRIRNEDELFDLIQNDPDSLSGKWILPPICLLAKTPLYEDRRYYTYLEHFYCSGQLGDSFADDKKPSQHYWSCTPSDDSSNHIQTMSIKHASTPKNTNADTSINVRPIRLVRRKLN